MATRHLKIFERLKSSKDGRGAKKEFEMGETLKPNNAAGHHGTGTYHPNDPALGEASEPPKTQIFMRSKITQLLNGEVHSDTKLHYRMDDGSVEVYRSSDIGQMDMKGSFKRPVLLKSSDANAKYSKIKMTENQDGTFTVEKTLPKPVSNAKKLVGALASVALATDGW